MNQDTRNTVPESRDVDGEASPTRRWTFLTNHAHVLLCIAEEPQIRLRDVAGRVGITERAAQRILSELIDAGYVTRKRVGRRNEYEVDTSLPFRHPLERDHEVGALLDVFRA